MYLALNLTVICCLNTLFITFESMKLFSNSYLSHKSIMADVYKSRRNFYVTLRHKVYGTALIKFFLIIFLLLLSQRHYQTTGIHRESEGSGMFLQLYHDLINSRGTTFPLNCP